MEGTKNEVKFTSDLIKTDVTALKILRNDILLIGIGHVAHIYSISNNCLILKSDVFVGQKIHGFFPATLDNSVVVFGGKQAKIFTIKFILPGADDAATKLKETKIDFKFTNKHLKCNDWITNLIWIEREDKIAILTAHNVIQIWNLTSNSITNSYLCEEKCILYSGILTEISDHVLVMAGTAFSQVVLWSTKCEQVLHRIKGHKGVIFSISYCKDNNIIVTTSDDRSVRIWNIFDKNRKDSNTADYWENIVIKSQANMFGHTARVISSTVLDNAIISIGEDAIMCAWNLQGNLLNKKKVFQGGGLWCVDCDDKEKLIVTGGSNSGVVLHERFCESLEPESEALNFPDKMLTAKKIALTARGNIVCITEQGYLMYYDFEMAEWSIKHEISYSKTYLCMSQSLCKQFIAFAGISGQIDVFLEPCKFDPNLVLFLSNKITENKIMSLHWVTNRCLLVCDENGEISLLCSQNQTCTTIATFTLPKCKERWLTSAALEPLENKYLLVGDRCGNFYLFKKGINDPLVTLPKIHGRLGINSIEFYNGKIITTGRDGTIKYFSLNEKDVKNTQMLKYLYHVKLPFEWVNRFIDREKNIICGFQETNLILWDLKDQTNILSVNCGGGHRSWDVLKGWQEFENKRQNILRFIFIKNSVVQVVSSKFQQIASNTIVRGFHSKEINAIKCISVNVTPWDSFYLISAGEDTCVHIAACKIECGNIHYDKVLDLNNHLSSIRCMSLVEISNVKSQDVHKIEYILYSAGGRAQICTSKVVLNILGNNSQTIEYFEFGNYMLKGTDLERKKKDGGWSNISIELNAETRFMSLDYISQDSGEPFNNQNNFLLAGCSDGYLRVFKSVVDQNKCELHLYLSLEYHKRCILKVCSFKIENNYIVMTLAVDGSVAFWNYADFTVNHNDDNVSIIKPFHKLKIHKAGINCVDLDYIHKDQIILATGGDDNAIHLNILRSRDDESKLRITEVCKWSCDTYHCSQITGIKLFKDNIMASVSIDQRVTIMKWTFDSENILCTYIGQYYSTVPDLQGFEVIKCNRNKFSLCLFGKGIEILSVDL